VRKSRMGLGVPAEEVAQAANIPLLELQQFEEESTIAEGVHWSEVCQLLELDQTKFKHILNGWHPSPVNHAGVHQISTDDGGMEVNAYLIWDEETNEAALFDTGWNPSPIQSLLEKHHLTLKHLFITHQHHDHVAAMVPLREAFPNMQCWAHGSGVPKNNQVNEGDSYHLGSLTIRARLTPGHAPDGVTYLVDGIRGEYPGLAIVGDALFAGSMGGAPNHFQLAKSKVREVILSLPENTLICPGHGPMTTVAQEQAFNPLF